jgi:DNA-binding transcriptional LysR family regulator
MDRSLLDAIEAFVRVAHHGSFRSAAEDLHLSPSALSQKIKALEARMGVALLMRTTRSVGLTQAGEILLARAAPAFADLVAAYDEARNLSAPSGLLRLHMPRGMIPLLVEPILSGFCEAYPQIDVEICAEDHPIDLIKGGFDAGVRLGEMLDPDMIAVRVTPPVRFVVVGAPQYFTKHEPPRRPADLRHHSCVRIRYGQEGIAAWYFMEAERTMDLAITGRLIVNDFGLGITASLQGLGLLYVAERMVGDQIARGDLLTVLDEYVPTSSGVFLYYPNRTQALPKLRVFIDYLLSNSVADSAFD